MTYLEAVQKEKEIVAKYTEYLQAFGYQDIYVKIPHYLNYKELPTTVEITHLEIYFWDNDYGYSLNFGRGSGDLSTDTFVADCNQIINFLSDPASLKAINLKEHLPLYLEANGFISIHISSFLSNESYVHLSAFKDDIKYIFYFKRINAAEEALVPFEEDDENEEADDNDKYHETLDSFKKKFDGFLKETLKTSKWESEISTDFRKVFITRQPTCGVKMHWEILSYWNNLFVDEVEDSFREIIACVLDKEPTRQLLQDEHFHIHDNPHDKDSFFVYKEGERYEIKGSIERIAEYESVLEAPVIRKSTVDFDHMEGHAFEHFCAKVLTLNGFEKVRVTQGSGDQGIDIIAFKDGIKYGIQCKCYSSAIGNKAVQEVFAGKTFYQCHVGIVLTNNYFTNAAIELAQRNGVVLWNRDKLKQMVQKCQSLL